MALARVFGQAFPAAHRPEVREALGEEGFEVVGLSSMSWRDTSFAEGARQSQKMNEEILSLMKLTDRVSHPLGANKPMPNSSTPVDSPAARDIISKAKETAAGRKLRIFVLGAYTNVASALPIDPGIRDKIAVYVMGYDYIHGQLQTDEFNCQGDQNAAACLLNSGVELHVMAASTLRDFYWAKADVDVHFKGKGGIRDYLVNRWESRAPNSARRILWDIAVFEAFLHPDLAKLEEVARGGFKISVWTSVDKKAMQADYWDATNPR